MTETAATAQCCCEVGYECLDCARRRIARREADVAPTETDRVYAFCVTGTGHPIVNEVGSVDRGAFLVCQTCGTDLTNDHLINPKDV